MVNIRSNLGKTPLSSQDEVLELLEKDLMNKAKECLNEARVGAVLFGVFSVDDLERKSASDIEVGRIAIGVGYVGCQGSRNKPHVTDGGNGAQMSEFVFNLIIAGRVDSFCKQLHGITRILTVLRKEINHSKVLTGNSPGDRPWVFVQERPEIAESDDNMLYYSQSWSITLPLVS